MTPEQQQQLLALLADHQYLLLSYLVMALVIGALVRLCKSDSPIPLLAKIPAVWRPRIAVALGIVGGVLSSLAAKVPLSVAIGGGIIAAFTAVTGHEVIIEGGRGGSELFGPKGGLPTASTARESRRPPALRMIAIAMFGVFVGGCAGAVASVPGDLALAQCIGSLARVTPPLTFVEYLARGLEQCGGDLLTILDEVLASTDPAVAQYQQEARDAKADKAKLDALSAKVGAYRAAHPEIRKGAK